MPDSETITVQLAATNIRESQDQPDRFNLEQNYPNPFNPSTTIRYALAAPTSVRLKVYNSLGQHIKTLVDASQAAGAQEVIWDGTDHANQPASAGTYIYELATEHSTLQRPMLLLH
ncbi:MAG: T9SS type A sorting domain-containing protein [Gemmatimonadetes bacterium]|nr:T9SS type A sorting domain-containing protein [Gemmatimonadota bacterium]